MGGRRTAASKTRCTRCKALTIYASFKPGTTSKAGRGRWG